MGTSVLWWVRSRNLRRLAINLDPKRGHTDTVVLRILAVSATWTPWCNSFTAFQPSDTQFCQWLKKLLRTTFKCTRVSSWTTTCCISLWSWWVSLSFQNARTITHVNFALHLRTSTTSQRTLGSKKTRKNSSTWCLTAWNMRSRPLLRNTSFKMSLEVKHVQSVYARAAARSAKTTSHSSISHWKSRTRGVYLMAWEDWLLVKRYRTINVGHVTTESRSIERRSWIDCRTPLFFTCREYRWISSHSLIRSSMTVLSSLTFLTCDHTWKMKFSSKIRMLLKKHAKINARRRENKLHW